MKKNSLSYKYMHPQEHDNAIIYTVKALYGRYTQDNLSQIGGQLAYFFILSIFPVLMFISQIVGLLYIDTAELSFILSDFLPTNVLDIIFEYLRYANETQSREIFTFSAISSVFIASKALTSIIYALNRAYRVDIRSNNIQKKIIAFIVTLFLVFALILSLALITVGKPLFYNILEFLRLDNVSLQAWTMFRWSVSLSTLFLTLYLIYFIIPNHKIPRKYNVIGTLFTMVSLLTMSLVFAYYVNNFSKYTIIYGSLGAVMLLLLYLYFSGIIIVLGGELIHIIYHRSIGNYQYDVR